MPPPQPPPLPPPYCPMTFLAAAGWAPRHVSSELESLMRRNNPEMSLDVLPLKRKRSSRLEVFDVISSGLGNKVNLWLEGPPHWPGLRPTAPCSSTHPNDDDEQQQPSASTEEGGGGGGAADGAVTINPDESLRQEIRIEIDSVPLGGADDERSRRICRVHPSIREKEGHAYEPKLISIGPLHHGKRRLQPMEATKRRYVRMLMARSPESNTLEGYIAAIREIEDRAREAYPSEDGRCYNFAKILLVDGCFMIEYMLREFFRQRQDEDEWGSFHNLERDLMLLENQIPFFRQQQDEGRWGTSHNLERDLMLLENQIPFFVLQALFYRTSLGEIATSLGEIALRCLGVQADRSNDIITMANRAYHLLHLSHMCWYGCRPRSAQVYSWPMLYSRARHAVVAVLSYPIRLIKEAVFCLLFLLLINEWPWSRHKPDLRKQIPCATDLDMSGVKFRRKVLRRSSSSMQEHMISFRRGEGVLEIPFVAVGQTLNTRLRNFIALEQCHQPDDLIPCHCAAYVSFMNSIIYTPADVALLRKYGVIEISFGSDEDVAKMFKSIYEDTNLYKIEIKEISQLSEEVNAYCDVAYHRWRGRLRSSYLRSPWSAVALLAAIIFLGR